MCFDACGTMMVFRDTEMLALLSSVLEEWEWGSSFSLVPQSAADDMYPAPDGEALGPAHARRNHSCNWRQPGRNGKSQQKMENV